MLIAFHGRIGSGKSEAALAVVGQLGYYSAHFAEPIKVMLASYLRYRRVDDFIIRRMLYGDLKRVPSPHLQGRSPREAMESLGDGWGREMMARDFWIEAMDARGQYRRFAGGQQRIVIEDLRRQNEADYVRAIGGKIIGLSGGDPDRDVRSHASETEIVVPDVTLHNCFTPAFHENVVRLVRELEAA